jgi:FMN-dependent NADH-azoreductase
MSKVLLIKANPKEDNQSDTFKLANKFLEQYKKNNPDDEIITLDLYKEGIDFLNQDILTQMFTGKDNIAKKYALQFASADKYIIAAPMWNLSIPAILKAYIDYVVYVGITFKYTEKGPIGLLKDKKAVHIVSRGGMYSEGPAMGFELGDKYLRTILAFLGVYDFKTVELESTGVLTGDDLENSRIKAANKAVETAKEF